VKTHPRLLTAACCNLGEVQGALLGSGLKEFAGCSWAADRCLLRSGRKNAGGLSGLAAEVGEQCMRMQQQLDGVMAVACHLRSASPLQGTGQPADEGRLASMRSVVSRLEAEAAALTGSCKRLAGMIG